MHCPSSSGPERGPAVSAYVTHALLREHEHDCLGEVGCRAAPHANIACREASLRISPDARARSQRARSPSIVERAADQPYASFLAREIFEPLGMEATFAGSGAGKQTLAIGHQAGTPVKSFELDTVGMGAGDVWSGPGQEYAASAPARLCG